MAGWEKAAVLLGAALSPVSTIASLALAPPAEETIFDRQIKGPDGKPTILPRTTESVVPRMKKRERAAQKPNPIMDALQRHFKLGPHADPANDIAAQKINDRNFLVHATRPKDSNKIRKMEAILPSGEYLPDKVLDDPTIKKIIAKGQMELYRSPFTGNVRLESPEAAKGHPGPAYKIGPNKLLSLGEPGIGPNVSPGVSLSRQMSVPALNEEKSYRFLLDPKERKTFSTSEPGYGKAGREEFGKRITLDRHESEERTYGAPYPVKPANRAITPDVPELATEERVKPQNVDRYRATMGNETARTILERIGFGTPSRAARKAKYEKLKAQADALYEKIMAPAGSFSAEEYKKIGDEWQKAFAAQSRAFDDLNY